MKESRLLILELLAQGKLTPAEAERLLERLGPWSSEQPVTGAPAEAKAAESAQAAGAPGRPTMGAETRPPKFLRMVVDSPRGEVLNVQIPVALLRGGAWIGSCIPEEARRKLDEQGVRMGRFAGLSEREFVEAIAQLKVDVDGPGGEKVRVYCE